MAQKQEFTYQELVSKNKSEVKELAQSLHLKTHALSKEQLMAERVMSLVT